MVVRMCWVNHKTLCIFTRSISFYIMGNPLVRLSDIPKGKSCIIESFTDDTMKQKLLEMGCLPGETITVSRLAPLGCPMAIIVEGATLSLRIEEAENIIVKRI